MTRRQRRLAFIGSALGVLALALGLVLYAMSDSIVFFRAPSEIAAKGVQPGTRFRLGGLVKEGSIQRGQGQIVTFEVTDAQATVPVRYQGLLPDLFREGQGVVAEGVLDASGAFRADTVLAKHDETYMPREIADALKKQGLWKASRSGEATKGSSKSPRPRGGAARRRRPSRRAGASQDEALPGSSPHPRCACFRLDKGPEALSAARGRGGGALVLVEAGHFALALALAVAGPVRSCRSGARGRTIRF